MVASGVGISVVPVSAMRSWAQGEPQMEFRRFADPAPYRRVVIAWRATFPRPRAIDALREALLSAPPPGVVAIN
jgi:LysR family hydrogen peroxide-inducible transcriptional activator